MAHTVGLTTIHARYKLHSLPVWLCLQSLGHEGVVERVKFSRDLVRGMCVRVRVCTNLSEDDGGGWVTCTRACVGETYVSLIW